MRDDFIYGLGTHFNGWVAPEKLKQVATRFTGARVDVQIISGADARQHIADAEAADLKPIAIFDTNDQIAELPDGGWIEKQNEVNIGLGRPAPIPANQYRDDALEGYELAKKKGCTYVAGAAANLEQRDIDWFNDLEFSKWPEDIIAVTHRYAPRDEATQAHRLKDRTKPRPVFWNPLTWNRDYEVELFQKAIGANRKWVITEFGYRSGPTGRPISHVAAQIAQEWAFWQKFPLCLRADLYQINDSPIDDHDFGLYDANGVIKQEIFETVPLRHEVLIVANEVISRSCLIPLANKPGKFSAYASEGNTSTVVYMDQNGNVGTNPASSMGGAFETFSVRGDIAVFDETGSKLNRGIRIV